MVLITVKRQKIQIFSVKGFKYLNIQPRDSFPKRGEIMAVQKKFPTFASILLVVGVIWLLSELGVISVIRIPWIPVVLIFIAISMLYSHYYKNK